MPQLRLTTKIAKELKIIQLQYPNNCTRLYDDWYLDVTKILRKKIFVFMHIQTRITLAIPSYEIGGIQNLFNSFPVLLQYFLNELRYDNVADQAYNFFTCSLDQMSFVKTDDKSTLRYISDFINILRFKAERSGYIDQFLCDSTSKHWLSHLINNTHNSTKYTTPLRLLKKLLGKPI